MALSSEGFCKGVHNFLIPVVILAVIVLTLIAVIVLTLIAVISTKENPKANSTLIVVNSTKEKPEDFLWVMFSINIVVLIVYWIYEYSATAQAKYFQQLNHTPHA